MRIARTLLEKRSYRMVLVSKENLPRKCLPACPDETSYRQTRGCRFGKIIVYSHTVYYTPVYIYIA
jgi:hypothetical protein